MRNKLLLIFKGVVPLVLLYGAICLVFGFLQRSMIYFPDPRPNSAVDFIELERGDVTVRVSVHACDSQRAVIYFGGNAEDVSLALRELSQTFPNAFIYAMHYRGYGGSTGSPSEADLHSDARALYDLVKQGHREIIVVGRSLGSGLATPLCADCEVHRLILITPFDSLVNVAKYHYPFLPVSLLLQDRYESHQSAGRVQSPTLVLIAERDPVVPRQSTLDLIEAFSDQTCWSLILPGTDHNSIAMPAAIVQQFVDDPQSLPASMREGSFANKLRN